MNIKYIKVTFFQLNVEKMNFSAILYFFKMPHFIKWWKNVRWDINLFVYLTLKNNLSIYIYDSMSNVLIEKGFNWEQLIEIMKSVKYLKRCSIWLYGWHTVNKDGHCITPSSS